MPTSTPLDHGRSDKSLLVRGLVRPALWTLFLFVVLVGLGVWQVQRLAWKNQLLTEIDRAEQQPAEPLTGDPRPFEKVIVSGRWLPMMAHYGVEVRDTHEGPRMGSQLVAPLARPGAPAVLVLLGWVSDGVPVVLPSGDVQVVGYVRPAEHRGWLSAGDNARTLRFFSLDPGEIGKALGVDVEPFAVVVLQDSDTKGQGPHSGPAAATQLPRPLNNHLSYAFTWFGLAATLLAVFGVWVRKHLAG